MAIKYKDPGFWIDLLFEFIYNATNSAISYMVGSNILQLPGPASWTLAIPFGLLGMANHYRALRKESPS